MRAAVKFGELAEKVVGRARFFLQHKAQEVLRLHKGVHQRAEGLCKIKTALFIFLEFAQYGAAHAQRSILHMHELFLPPHAIVKDGARDAAAFFARKQPEYLRIELFHAIFHIGGKARRIQICQIVRVFALGNKAGLQFDPLARKRAEIIVVQRGRAHFFQFEHLRKLVDEGVEADGGRNDEHVAGAQALIVIHEIAQTVQHDHRLAATRAALQHKALPLRAGDDIELFFLNGADDIAHLHIVLAAADDIAQIGIEEDLVIPAADLLGSENVAHRKIFIAEIEQFPVPDRERTPQNGAVFVFVDGKRDAALLIVTHGKRRAPVHDLQIDVSAFADIVTVVALLVVHNVHAGEIGLGKEGTIFVDLFFERRDFGVLFLNGAKILRPVTVLRADGGDLLLQRGDAFAVAQDIDEFEHAQNGVKMPFFILALLIRIEEREIPRLVGVDLGTQQFFCRSALVHTAPPPEKLRQRVPYNIL